MKKLSILFLLIFTFVQTYSQWGPLGNGMNSGVYSLTGYGGRDVTAGGFFSTAGGVHANKIAEWFGSSWLPLGSGVDTTAYGLVYSLTVGSLGSPFVNFLFVGGTFSQAGGDTAAQNIAKWDGSQTGGWSPLGNGLNGGVHAILNFANTLIVGGDFLNVRYGVPAQYVAQWNGSSWNILQGGVLDARVNALINYNGNLIAGGDFTHAGSITANHIVQWNGSSWTPLGSGVDNFVYSLTVYNGNLIAGGNFTHAGGVSANFIAQWNGSSWAPLGNGLGGIPVALNIFHNKLVAGTFGGTPNFIYQWDGSSWTTVGGGTNGNVNALYVSDFFLFAGGQFTTAGGVSANNIAQWIEPGNVIKHENTLNKPILSHQTTRDTTHLYDSTGGNYDINTSFYVTDVNIAIDTVTYPVDSDLEFHLVHRSVTDTLIYQAGGNGANFTGTILNDSASAPISNGTAPFTGSFRPSKPLTQFNGQDPGGDWILEVYDRGTGNTGTLEAWTLNISYSVNPIGVKPISSEIPKTFKLNQNYPNPFNPSTKINFALPKSAFVKLTIYDILGREVAEIVDEQLKAGSYEAEWNAGNFASGIYFYSLVTPEFTQTKKMILVK